MKALTEMKSKEELEKLVRQMLKDLEWAETMLTLLKDSLPNPDTFASHMKGVYDIRKTIATVTGNYWNEEEGRMGR